MQEAGILIVNKDPDISSFAVIARLRKILALKRIGHAGTLDPFATGVLPVALARATGAIQFMQAYDKTYEVLAVLGTRTASGDREGEVLAQVSADQLNSAWLDLKAGQLQEKLLDHQGQLDQVPPMYSALKYQGRPLYSYAREGKELERKTRKVQVKLEDWELLDRDQLAAFQTQHPYLLPPSLPAEARYFFYARLQVSKGTYIRSWIDDLGEDLGVHAYCEGLCRVSCGPFQLANSLTTEDLFEVWRSCGQDAKASWTWLQDQGYIQPLLAAFPGWPRLPLTSEQALALTQGKLLDVSAEDLLACLASPADLPDLVSSTPGPQLILTYEGTMLAMGQIFLASQGYYIKSMRVFASHEDLSRA